MRINIAAVRLVHSRSLIDDLILLNRSQFNVVPARPDVFFDQPTQCGSPFRGSPAGLRWFDRHIAAYDDMSAELVHVVLLVVLEASVLFNWTKSANLMLAGETWMESGLRSEDSWTGHRSRGWKHCNLCALYGVLYRSSQFNCQGNLAIS